MATESASSDDLYRLPESINFPQEEETVLQFWKDEKAFENCQKQSKGKPRYMFYDGPPFATGLPHYGHILAGTIKDVVTRYAYQQGYHVERRFGWDCHGLPVEYEIDKALNIKGPEDVAKMGIAAYNNECRKIVMRYAGDWEKIVGRMGRWIDFKNDYKTLYPWFMESVWWVFKQLFAKGLVYQGVKVMPFSTGCTTALSNFEAGQNFKEVVDPCVVVTFPIIDDKDKASFLAWTTTPWTLPSNLALCVNPEMVYVRVKEVETGAVYVLAECRLEYVFKEESRYEILDKFPGASLVGKKYEPLFNYFLEYAKKYNAFRVLSDGYVTDDAGTGIVHQAPYFGEDDYRVCLGAGIIERDSEIICPVDMSGKFMDSVTDFKGLYVKDADKKIIAHLKGVGRLHQASQMKHSYPFCWRSDTPLIYKAVPSWFIRVEQMSQQLLACSSQTYWVPEFVKEKRFGNWLRDARDWAVSRNRYWGTPIPIWCSQDGEEIVCIGSIAELHKLSGVAPADLHRETVDKIEIPSSRPGHPPLRRITEVFDCWFESGSMPYAQQHYPFENETEFMNCFPADFIAEGIDQTRGWFYTLLVISTALFNKPPFKNLIANGLVLAADGQKMSKRKQNYPDPMEVVHKYGADALRLYLINSPVVRAENLRFKEEGVRDIIKDVFLPWYNAYRFFFQNIARLAKEEGIDYKFDRAGFTKSFDSRNVMDIWISSFKESLLEFVSHEMKAYRLYTVVPRLTKFIDLLTNWYVRLNRRRIKGEMGPVECRHSLDTLYDVLYTMVKMMAPFTPFLSEFMFKRLAALDTTKPSASVHYQMMPVADKSLIRLDIERAVSRMQSVVELGRIVRDRKTLPTKYPVPELVVIHTDEQYLKDIESLSAFILGELNVRTLTTCSDKHRYGVSFKAEPDHKKLGLRLKNDFKAVLQAIKQLKDDEIQSQLTRGYFEVLGNRIELDEIRVTYGLDTAVVGDGKYEAHSDNEVLVLIDITPSDDMIEEGYAKEIINRIQKLKKKAKLVPTDPVVVYYNLDDAGGVLGRAAAAHLDLIQTTIKSDFKVHNPADVGKMTMVIEESYELKGTKMNITICSTGPISSTAADSSASVGEPTVAWCNLQLLELEPRYGATTTGALLLQDRQGKFITLEQLRTEVERLFGLYGRQFVMSCGGKAVSKDTKSLNGKTVVVSRQLAPGKHDLGSKPCVPWRFVDVKGKNVTVFVENPKSVKLI